jgi:hypothetical protein
MRTRHIPVLLAVIIGSLARPALVPAQETMPQDEHIVAYRLDFVINELDDGKKVNSRHYSMNLSVGPGNLSPTKELRIGTRVPVESEQGKFQYLDVGTNISAQLREWKGAASLDVNVNISNFASPDQETKQGQPLLAPLLRQMVISGSTLVVLDKPVVVGTVDDPNSKRQFQLEVTVTKLK